MVRVIRSEEYAKRLLNSVIKAVYDKPNDLSVFTRLMRFSGSRGEDNPVIAANALRSAATIYRHSHPERAAMATRFAEVIEQQAKAARRG